MSRKTTPRKAKTKTPKKTTNTADVQDWPSVELRINDAELNVVLVQRLLSAMSMDEVEGYADPRVLLAASNRLQDALIELSTVRAGLSAACLNQPSPDLGTSAEEGGAA